MLERIRGRETAVQEASAEAEQEARVEAERILSAARKSAQAQADAILENAKIECASIERSAAAHMRDAANSYRGKDRG